MGQILRNLLGNAVIHSSTGGRVCVTVVAGHDQLHICVRNDGAGIERQHLPYVFDRFYRADRSRNRATGGSGLGLAIVKALVEMHGGRIWIESTPGESTAVTFTLPIV